MLAGLTGLLGGGGAAGTFESIATATPSGTGTVTFSAIPSTYKHLQIRHNSIVSNTNFDMTVRLNGDTAANYTRHIIWTDLTTVSRSGSAGTSAINVKFNVNAGSIVYPYAGVIDIIDYSNTNKNKTLRNLLGHSANLSTYGDVQLSSGLWMNTNAVTSVTIAVSAGLFTAGSQFSLYGIKG